MPHHRKLPPTYRELLDSRPPERIDVADAIVWSHLEAEWLGKKLMMGLAGVLIVALCAAAWFAIHYAGV